MNGPELFVFCTTRKLYPFAANAHGYFPAPINGFSLESCVEVLRDGFEDAIADGELEDMPPIPSILDEEDLILFDFDSYPSEIMRWLIAGYQDKPFTECKALLESLGQSIMDCELDGETVDFICSEINKHGGTAEVRIRTLIEVLNNK